MLFFHNLENFKNKIALEDEDGSTISYKGLAEKADLLAKEIGTTKKLIFIKCQRNIETIVGYLAALRGGHAVVMLNAELDENLFQQLQTHYQPNGIWMADNDAGQYHYHITNNQLVSLHPDLALLLSTSGSTGSPKLVRLSKKNINANAKSIAEYLHLNDSEIPVANLPFHYSYGLSIINSHLLVGAKILLSSHPIVSNQFWDFFNKARATSFAGVPYTYEMLCLAQIEKKDLPSLRYFTQAGGKLSPDLMRHFSIIAKDKGVKFYPMYGQTEATARISWLSPDKVMAKPESIGKAIPGGKIKLETDNTVINEAGKEGELIYYGDNVMMGYAEMVTDLALGYKLKGALRTGDLAKFDHDGYYYITGRVKRFIKIIGSRVNLDEIEQALTLKQFNCKCTGRDNLLLIATLGEDAQIIKRHIMEKYHFHQSHVKVTKVESFPYSSTGKVLYAELLEKLT